MCCVNIALTQSKRSIKPASVYQRDGITFASPNQSGWVLSKSNNLETVFEKRDKDATSRASVKIIKTKIFETDTERLIGFETLKKEELSKLNRDSIHFNYVRFKGLMCLQYDGIFRLDAAAAANFKYCNLKGYLCPRANAKDSAIEMEFSVSSTTRGMTEDLNSLSDEFFERTTIPKQQ
jgi:hypothetical protein